MKKIGRGEVLKIRFFICRKSGKGKRNGRLSIFEIVHLKFLAEVIK
jgi:hypothetical protein